MNFIFYFLSSLFPKLLVLQQSGYGQKLNINDKFPTIIDPYVSIISDEMTLIPDQESIEDNESTKSTTESNSSSPPECRMYKYASRYGYTEGNDEVLIFYNKKLEEKKYGSKNNIYFYEFLF